MSETVPTKILPPKLTSYDLLKTLAVILMIVDHAGYYFFPDNNWWRVFGRFCVPMWFFLIGYAHSRDLSPKLWIGAGLLVLGSMIYGHYILPFNILATIIIVRLLIDPLMNWALKSGERMALLCTILLLLIIPTNFFAEYGSSGLILAMMGYLLRRKEQLKLSDNYVRNYMVFAYFSFVISQYLFHGFTPEQFTVLCIGIFGVFFMLMQFCAKTVERKVPTMFVPVFKFGGRRTLEIYVVHILIFGFTAMALGDPRFGLFEWQWMPALW